MDAAPARHIGKYKILKVLGAGGMGEVLLAEDDRLRRVAIKRPLRSADSDTLARFQVEKSVASLVHPNIPRVYELGEQDGLPYIAMEFVEGESLDKIIAANKLLDLITKLGIIEQVCLGLGYAHQQGIIHRDVKPANIIVQANGVAKIIDFGIAKVDAPGAAALTKTSQLIGTLHYIAPERFKGEMVDRRSDIFSLGAVLYELLTGKLLFAGGENTAFHKIMNAEPASLADQIQDYPPALDAILAHALAKDPNDRYTYAEDFGDDLHAVIEELKRTGVLERLNRAEKLTMEGRFSSAIEVLDEAMRLDPANTQVRKLKKFVRNKQEEKRRDERVVNLIQIAEKEVASEDFVSALACLNEAYELNPNYAGLTDAITELQQKKQHQEVIAAVLLQAAEFSNRGDYPGALETVTVALSRDPENPKLLEAHAAFTKLAESVLRKSKAEQITALARNALEAGKYAAVEPLLAEAEQVEPGYSEVDSVRRKAIAVLESVLLDFRDREDIKELLAKSRRALTAKTRALSIERCKIEVQSYVKDGRFDDAIHSLEKCIEETGDENLPRYLAELIEHRAAATRRFQLLWQRVADLREQGDLDGALQLVQEHSLSTPKVQGADQLLAELLAERERRDTIQDAIERAREAIANKDFEGASKILQSVVSIYGDLPELRSELRELETARAAFAKEHISKAVTTARKAFLNSDANGALETLNGVAEMLEFADESTREDWKRIAVSAQDATQQTSVKTTKAVALGATQLDFKPKSKKASKILFACAAVIVVVCGVVILNYARPHSSAVAVNQSLSGKASQQHEQSTQPGNAPPPAVDHTDSGVAATTSRTEQLQKNNPEEAAKSNSSASDLEDWRRVSATPSLAGVDQYLEKHANGAFRSQAISKREDLVWSSARSTDTQASIDQYLQQYPSGKYSQAAKDELKSLDLKTIRSSSDPATLNAFLTKYPSGGIHAEIENRLDDVFWSESNNGVAGLRAYLSKFPNGTHASEARNRLRSAQQANSTQTIPAPRVTVPPENSGASSYNRPVDDKAAILAALNAYQAAYDRQDIAGIQQVWPTMTDRQRKEQANLFKSGVAAVRLTIEVLSGPDITGSEAVVTASEIMAISRGGAFDTHTRKVVIKLKKAESGAKGNNWFIEAIR